MTRVFLLILLFAVSTSILFSQDEDAWILPMIENGDYRGVRKALKNLDPNGYYGDDKRTLLHTAIENNQYEIVELLVKKGADLEQHSKGQTPLIYTVIGGKQDIAAFLIRKGANVNGVSDKSNSALIIAAVRDELEMAMFLVSKGANINHKNEIDRTPLDYANLFQSKTVAYYLRSLNAESESMYYPDYYDGPHLYWTNNDTTLNAFYLERDSAANEVTAIPTLYTVKADSMVFYGFGQDNKQYEISKRYSHDPYHYNNTSKVMVIGDIHGYYSNLVKFLRGHNIIDKDLNWSWDDGHLVFMGDIFDRGSDVTDALWMIYNLDTQAKKVGGRVHLLIGNHELMAMYYDYRDLSSKYVYLTQEISVEYSAFFNMETVLGRWLRTRNTMITINGDLFVHGGISSRLVSDGYTVEEVNLIMRNYLSNGLDSIQAKKAGFLLSDLGPFWYRGYFGMGENYPKASQEDVDNALGSFNVEHIIVGHTNVKEISTIYNNRIIATDIPFYLRGVNLQGLLINNEGYHKARYNGTTEKLF